ncbi:MAG: phytanoyl-CoA dioxygenase family protein [Planctomycetota bacterium]|nr:phytanoyl-CoA dioxygenase family protein [Planctomycetota bacterium]
MTARLTAAERNEYRSRGCLVVRGLFSAPEVARVLAAAERDEELDAHAFDRADGEGGRVRLSLWNHPGDDLYGVLSRTARVVERAEELTGGEVYHYHSKLILKDPEVGGAWAWHQDYGYWRENGLRAPDLVSMFVALDPANRDNGCLQVVPGSQQLGRLDHQLTGDQAGADPDQVAAALQRLDVEHVELAPGDALFFHPNLLHRSDQNRSAQRRWALICCYNRADNEPAIDHHHPCYTKLHKLPDEALMQVDIDRAAPQDSWLDPDHDHSARRRSP